MRRTATLGAAILTIGAPLLLAGTAQAAPEGVGVSFVGHACGADNVGPEPTCTYTPTLGQGYAGIGPFTIVAANADGTPAFSVSCAAGESCSDQAAPIPAGTSVTITVTGEGGNVGAGAAG